MKINNILFVCSANKQRSKTAEDYFSAIYIDKNFLSAGTNYKICSKEGTQFITEDMLHWSDIVYVMENKHMQLINKSTSNKFYNKIVVLNIQDNYKYYQKELINILIEKIKL